MSTGSEPTPEDYIKVDEQSSIIHLVTATHTQTQKMEEGNGNKKEEVVADAGIETSQGASSAGGEGGEEGGISKRQLKKMAKGKLKEKKEKPVL